MSNYQDDIIAQNLASQWDDGDLVAEALNEDDLHLSTLESKMDDFDGDYQPSSQESGYSQASSQDSYGTQESYDIAMDHEDDADEDDLSGGGDTPMVGGSLLDVAEEEVPPADENEAPLVQAGQKLAKAKLDGRKLRLIIRLCVEFYTGHGDPVGIQGNWIKAAEILYELDRVAAQAARLFALDVYRKDREGRALEAETTLGPAGGLTAVDEPEISRVAELLWPSYLRKAQRNGVR
ncbi:hypothetical protein C8Q77DRAFT_1152483 [Trametes polyzona]|nr:hypothetical protein C8Q77DRAFT_1152483 [Trametes polyzona]